MDGCGNRNAASLRSRRLVAVSCDPGREKVHPSYYVHGRLRDYSTKYIFSRRNAISAHENTDPVLPDCQTFEDMVAHSIFCSSRRHGIQGIPFDEFFACLLGEFQDQLWIKRSLHLRSNGKLIVASDLLKGYPSNVSDVSDRKIPFLAPLNTEWPQCHDDCNFGHLVRVFTRERCEVYVRDLKNRNERAMFLCECKYWHYNVDVNALQRIIDGLSQKWDWGYCSCFV